MRLNVVLIYFALAACSSQAVELRPQAVGTRLYANANGQLVTLAVRDERPTETIGMRGTTVRLGDITAAGDVPSIVSKAITDALHGTGFRVEQLPSTQADLVVDLRHLTFAEHKGMWTGKSDANAAINARVMRNGSIVFERLYRGTSASRGMLVGTARSNAGLVNASLTDAVQRLANDTELMAALALVRK